MMAAEMKRVRDETHSVEGGMMDWWQGKRIPCPAHLRVALETAVDDQHYREARFLAVLGVLVALISLTVDLVTIPEHFGVVAIVRLMVTAPVLLAVLAIPRSRLALQKFLLGAGLSALSLTLLFASGFAPPPADSFMAVGVIMMLGIALPLLPFRRRGILLFIAAVLVPSGILVIFQQNAEGYAETFLLILTLVATGAGVLARRFRWLDRRNALLQLQAEDRARELEQSNARLTELSMLDPLTDLANRRWAEKVFERDYAASSEDAPGLTAVLLLDLDHFKNFNDRWGHELGDKCLQAVAEVLRHCAGTHGGLAARFGGEEFVILLRVDDVAEALVLAEQVRVGVERIEIGHGAKAAPVSCTVSIGVALHEAAGRAVMGKMLRRADEALYRAKSEGRNRHILAA